LQQAAPRRDPTPALSDFFEAPLAVADPAVQATVDDETDRQRNEIELIASENIVSRAVLEAAGSVLTNKYAEGYPGRRYYAGCQFVDRTERLAIDRARSLFHAAHANVQPSSGSQANQSVLLALARPGDCILGMSLAAGGHLTHGAAPNLSGKWFRAASYGVRRDDQLIDYDELAQQAREERPRIIIAGGSAYPRTLNFERFRRIADEVDAFLMVDMAHIAGLVAAGAHPSPLPHAHVVTSTTHKTLRGPRGGLVLTNSEEIAKKINSAVFPGLQGGPLMHVIAAKAVAFGEALHPGFKAYARAVIENCKALGAVLLEAGYALSTGGTDTHLLLLNLRPKGLTGDVAEKALGRANITCNKNGIPFDPEKPTVTSGIRLGTAAGTTRGFGIQEFREIGRMIVEVLNGRAANGAEGNAQVEAGVKERATKLCSRFPIYTA
jgi:glycine hydroxymethyltransferase